jgi:hypothetical protein
MACFQRFTGNLTPGVAKAPSGVWVGGRSTEIHQPAQQLVVVRLDFHLLEHITSKRSLGGRVHEDGYAHFAKDISLGTL